MPKPPPVYKCARCGREFPRWAALLLKRSGLMFYRDSYEWHLIEDDACNAADAERRLIKREQREADDQAAWLDAQG